MKSVKEMTTAELVEEYNKIRGKSIKKFSSRAAGEAQVLAARKDAKGTLEAVKSLSTGESAGTPRQSSANRSQSTAESWKDKKVAASRKERTAVRVGGETYRSVAAAFSELKLPMKSVIPFRLALKKDERKNFEHDGKTYVFTTVKS